MTGLFTGLFALSGCGSAGAVRDPHITVDLTEEGAKTRPPSLADALGQMDPVAVAARCGPAVVVIVGATKQGSGAVLRERSLVVTNAHVVEGESALTIKFKDGRTVKGEVAIVDDEADLALIRIPPGDYATVALGDSDHVQPGQPVLAIGAPLGLEQTVTSGEIAAERILDGVRFLQISVPISHGSSGGGLFDRSGNLIGVTTGSIENGQNLNFAVPASAVKRLLAKEAAR